jgi:hypothetical protein
MKMVLQLHSMEMSTSFGFTTLSRVSDQYFSKSDIRGFYMSTNGLREVKNYCWQLNYGHSRSVNPELEVDFPLE